MKSKFDIIISGGGIPALLLAIHAAHAHFAVALIEPYPPEDILAPPCGRTAAIMQEGLPLIDSLPIWNDLLPHISPLKILRVIDGDTNKEFKASDIGLNTYGYNIPLPRLRKELWSLAEKTKNVHVFPTAAIISYSATTHNITADIGQGRFIEASLLVAADGRNSKIRETEKIKILQKDYKQSAITCLLQHSKPHNFTSTEFHREGGPFTLVPLPDNQSSLVWMMPTAEADRIKALRKYDAEAAIQNKTQNTLGSITLASGLASWPIITMHTNTLIAPRVVLMAEAAHVVPPTGAQGLNISLVDVSALLDVLQNARSSGGDIGARAILLNYERMRLPDIKLRAFSTQGLNELVKTQNGLLQNIRRAGLAATHDIPFIRKLAMRTGLRTKNTAINSQ